MIVRKSTADDVESILKVIDVARLIMRRSGNQSQWVDGYPDKACFLCDINADCSFVIEKEGRVVGTFALIKSPEPTYDVVFGGCGWRNPQGEYGVIHRLASNGECSGILGIALAFARSSYPDIRIDTHADNVIMRHLLCKNGFSEVGTILLSNGSPRVAYQWVR